MEHYYSADPSSRSEEKQITYELEGRRFLFWTDHGVFSIDRVDHGSDILIHAVRKEEPHLTGKAIDLGCGYGPIGISLAALLPGVQFHLIDVNERAMDLARRNAEENQVSDRIWVGTAEEVPAGEVDVVITNPPIRAGKAVIYDLFRKSYDWLAPTGRLYV